MFCFQRFIISNSFYLHPIFSHFLVDNWEIFQKMYSFIGFPFTWAKLYYFEISIKRKIFRILYFFIISAAYKFFLNFQIYKSLPFWYIWPVYIEDLSIQGNLNCYKKSYLTLKIGFFAKIEKIPICKWLRANFARHWKIIYTCKKEYFYWFWILTWCTFGILSHKTFQSF